MKAIMPASASLTVRSVSSAHFSSIKASMSSAVLFRASSAAFSTKARNFSFCATKSVSELTSITAALRSPSAAIRQRPSAAFLPPILMSMISPFFRRNLTAASILPLVSVRAFLQSIMPAPVTSLNCLTCAAVIIILSSFFHSIAKRLPHQSATAS